ncbi:hypothetical protein DIPPA_35060 [Diplonema papillatum]|nr:hypothetical protein DIPPA_35060 [Diplonema papillatum]
MRARRVLLMKMTGLEKESTLPSWHEVEPQKVWTDPGDTPPPHIFHHKYLVDAACVAQELSYKLPPHQAEKVSAALYGLHAAGDWTDACDIAMRYLIQLLDETTLLADLKERELINMVPTLTLISRRYNMLPIEQRTAELTEVVDNVTHNVCEAIVRLMMISGNLSATLFFGCTRSILTSKHSLLLVTELHECLSSSGRLQQLHALGRSELVRIPVLFSAVGFAKYEPTSRHAPVWNIPKRAEGSDDGAADSFPRFRNLKRIMHVVSLRLMEPAIFNSLTMAEIVGVVQGMVVCRTILPALLKAALLRVAERGLYTTVMPNLLAEFMYRTAHAKCVHPVTVKECFRTFALHLQQAHVQCDLSASDCALLIKAMYQVRMTETQFVRVLGHRILNDGLTLTSFYIFLNYYSIVGASVKGDELPELFASQALTRDLIENKHFQFAKMVKVISHLYKAVDMPPSMHKWFLLIVEREATEQHNVSNCIQLLAGIVRGKPYSDEANSTVSTTVGSLMRLFIGYVHRSEKGEVFAELDDVTIATFLWILTRLSGGARPVEGYAVRVLSYFIERPDLVSSLHPAHIGWVLGVLQVINRSSSLRDNARTVLLTHALRQEVLQEYDGAAAHYTLRALQNAGIIEEEERFVSILMKRVMDDRQLVSSLTYQVAIKLIDSLTLLHTLGITLLDIPTSSSAPPKNQPSRVPAAKDAREESEAAPVAAATKPLTMEYIKDLCLYVVRPNVSYVVRDVAFALRLVRHLAHARVRDPAILKLISEIASDLAATQELSATDKGFLVSCLVLLNIAKTPLVGTLARSVAVDGRVRELEIPTAKWLVYGTAKTNADPSQVGMLCDKCLRPAAADGTASAPPFYGEYNSRDLTLVLWSLCRLEVYPRPFFDVLVAQLVESETMAEQPFAHVKRNNTMTFLVALSKLPADHSERSENVSRLLALLLLQAVANGTVPYIEYTAMNALVAVLIERRVDCPEFFRAARAELVSKAAAKEA